MRPETRFPALIAAVLALTASPAAAYGPEGTAKRLAKHMRPAGSGSGALVVDLDTGERIFSSRSRTARVPASVQKLYTTSAAMLRLGEDARLDTEALAVEPLGLDGTLDGDLYLRGSGDPTLTTRDLKRLARSLVRTTGLSRVTGVVVGDESAFDTLRGPPSEGYAVGPWVAPLGALIVDRGRTGRARPYYQADPAAFAATVFARALRGLGVRVAKRGVNGTTPPGALALARTRSPTIGTLVEATNAPSDNFLAEMLLKVLGRDRSGVGTTSTGAAAVRGAMRASFEIRPRVADGSGLSRSNRTSPAQVVRLLTQIDDRDEWTTFYDSLSIAGRNGTLEKRMRATRARDRCRGKTGTLNYVSNVAGYCVSPDGSTLAFSILMNGVSVSGAHRLQDRMLDVMARYSSAG